MAVGISSMEHESLQSNMVQRGILDVESEFSFLRCFLTFRTRIVILFGPLLLGCLENINSSVFNISLW